MIQEKKNAEEKNLKNETICKTHSSIEENKTSINRKENGRIQKQTWCVSIDDHIKIF